jgi:hypothetical protein
MKKIIALVIIISFGYISAVAKPGQADNKPQIAYQTVKVGAMVFQSAVDGKNLKVKVFAPTTGWIAVGFDPKFMMKGANFIIGYAENNQVVIEDEFGVGTFRHKRDVELGGKDDILEKSANILANGTEISFTMPLDSGDPYDIKLEAGKTYKIILAYGKTTDLTKKHAKKHSAELKL